MIQAPANNAHGIDNMALDLTAMLDVIFILLVFFILTANAAEYALEMNLPQKGAEQAAAITSGLRLNLQLLADDQWVLNQRRSMTGTA